MKPEDDIGRSTHTYDTWFGYLKRGFARKLPEDRIAGRNDYASVWASLRGLRPFIARHWRKGAIGAVLVLVTTLLGFPQPLINRFMIDDAILGGRLDQLIVALLMMLGVQLLGMLAGPVKRYYFARFEQEIILELQEDLFKRTLHFPKSFFDQQEVGYLMSRLGDLGGLRWFFSSTLVEIATNIIRLVGGVVLLFYLKWQLALVALVIIPGLVAWVRVFSGRMRALSHQSREHQANVTRRMHESLSSAALIKSFVSEDREVDRIMDSQRSAYEVSLENTAVGSVARGSLGLLNSLANYAVLAVGAYWVITGHWTLGSLFAFRSYVGYVHGPAHFLANVNLQLQNALAALERVSALYDIVPEETGVGLPVERLRGEIEFRDVSFSYDAEQPVLRDVSCRIQPGERVAIVGPSGVGKTTLISLLLRFYQPTAGEIWFDGRPASEYELASLRQRIGYVSQSTLLLSGTVTDNLRYGNPDAGQEQVERACRVAGIHDFIIGLPGKYAAQVGERGINLSEGQKQRLALARALIKDPDILVLDEPTSALDSLVERSIFDALPSLLRDRTLFVVAHRLATIQDSDRILLLNESRLVGMGTHQSLLESSDLYRSLVANQQVVKSDDTDSADGS